MKGLTILTNNDFLTARKLSYKSKDLIRVTSSKYRNYIIFSRSIVDRFKLKEGDGINFSFNKENKEISFEKSIDSEIKLSIYGSSYGLCVRSSSLVKEIQDIFETDDNDVLYFAAKELESSFHPLELVYVDRFERMKKC